jgi:hypothetical protein
MMSTTASESMKEKLLDDLFKFRKDEVGNSARVRRRITKELTIACTPNGVKVCAKKKRPSFIAITSWESVKEERWGAWGVGGKTRS